MEEIVKIAHVGSEVEGDMIVERLRQSGIYGYTQITGAVRPKLYSGGLTAQLGVDIYVHQENQERAKELIDKWENMMIAEEDIQEEAVSSPEIAEDVLEYLEEQKSGNNKSLRDKIFWKGNRKRIAQITVVILLLGVLIFLVFGYIL